jgi:hypothetical protein
VPRRVWSCFSKASLADIDAIYDDVHGSAYAYDSNVVNHARVAEGDVVVVRDGQLVLGFGVVEDVASRLDLKPMRRCVRCGSASLQARKVARPRFRCNDCKATFDEPVVVPKEVRLYVASYADSWVPFESPVPVAVLDEVYAGADRQNAIRELQTEPALALLVQFSGIEGQLALQLADARRELAGGFAETVARRRIGQQRFRDALLDRFGARCAVTGEQPDAVLDAAHLVAYAGRPEHHVDEGLLLRADVHRLFDRLLITFDAARWTTEVAPPLLERHPRLVELDRRPIAVSERLRPSPDLLIAHRRQAHARWKDLTRE